MFISETLVTGGAETFVLRLASALHARGLNIVLVVLRGDLVQSSFVKDSPVGVKIHLIKIPLLKYLLKIDGLFFRLKINFSFVRWVQTLGVGSLIRNYKADLVHSNLLSADIVSSRACKLAGHVPLVTTMHGDYLAFESKGKSQSARILDFGSLIRELEQTLAHVVSISEQQISQLQRLMPNVFAEGRSTKIYNGYSLPTQEPLDQNQLEILNPIPDDALVIGMVARGIREKGWEVLIQAFNKLNVVNLWLVLVGDGLDLRALKDVYKSSNIIFTGNVSDPLRYIARFDVGCLPSRIPTESLPTVIIEYLMLGVPTVASDVGEVAKMIGANCDESAGMLIPLGSEEDMVQSLKDALQFLFDYPVVRDRMSKNAKVAAQKFEMDLCVDAYLEIYDKALKP